MGILFMALVRLPSVLNRKPMGLLEAIGEITLGDIMEILPFEDPIVVIEVDGETLWGALEGALETWPAQEG